MTGGTHLAEQEPAEWEELSPEERSKARVLAEFEQLRAQSDFFGWQLRLLDAGDHHVVFVRLAGRAGRVFVLKLTCDDYWQMAPLSGFIDPELFDSADDTTPFEADSYPRGDYVVEGRGPLPVLCIKGHRDYYASGWHSGWSVPPAHDHCLYNHVVNVRNALLDKWS